MELNGSTILHDPVALLQIDEVMQEVVCSELIDLQVTAEPLVLKIQIILFTIRTVIVAA